VLEVLRPFEEQNFDIAVPDDDDAQLQWIAMRASLPRTVRPRSTPIRHDT
jgi:hypothetical protein